MSNRPVLCAIDADGIATVTLNRPDVHNAVDEAVIDAFHKALVKVERDDRARMVVIGGHGTSFCAGADLNWMKRTAGYDQDQNRREALAFANMLRTLDTLGKPTIARVHGPVYGGGVGIVAACDIAIGSREAVFCFSEVRLGLIPAMISPYAVAAIGARRARRYMLTAERIDAAEAYRIGLLHDLCEAENLDENIAALVSHVLRAGPAAMAACKTLIAQVAHREIDAPLVDHTARAIAATRASPEGREGIAAFLDKRHPAWVADTGASARKAAAKKRRTRK